MSEERIRTLENKVVAAEAERAIAAAGLPVGVLLPHVTQHLRVTDDGQVRSTSGRSASELVEALKGSPDLAPVMGGGAKPSWQGKKYSEMTMQEKAEYTEAEYGG